MNYLSSSLARNQQILLVSIFVSHFATGRSCGASPDGAEGDEARRRQPRQWRAGGGGWGASRRAERGGAAGKVVCSR